MRKMQCNANFLYFLAKICSALQISFCKTDNSFCNLYIR